MKRKAKRTALTVVLTLLVIWLVTSFFIVNSVYSLSFSRRSEENWSLADEEESDYGTTFMSEGTDLLTLGAEKCSFISGKNTLYGYIFSVSSPHGLLVVSHGLGGEAQELSSVIQAFIALGWSVFTYDATGCGRSGGSSCRSLSQSALDLDRALDYVEHRGIFSGLPIVLLGHSWGGYAVTAVNALGHHVAAVASFSGYNSVMTMMNVATSEVAKGASPLLIPMMSLYSLARNGSYAGLTALDGIKSATDTKFLIIHGEDDSFVTFKKASIYHALAGKDYANVTTRSIYGRDHFNVFLSNDAVALQATYRERLRDYVTHADGEITRAEFETFLSLCDIASANALDMNLINDVNDFFLSAIA